MVFNGRGNLPGGRGGPLVGTGGSGGGLGVAGGLGPKHQIDINVF